MKNKFKVLGVMSGSSLDGLDIAYCEFTTVESSWEYRILQSELIPYTSNMRKLLLAVMDSSASEFASFDASFGRYIGEQCLAFVKSHGINPDFIASHGHTVFHQPDNGFTSQIGNGSAIHAVTGIPVIYDFRSLDVQLGGQGAPLVPIGDKLLFSDSDICLNLGGIANLSADVKRKRIAYDICYCNTPINYLMQSIGKTMDKGGEKASQGEVDNKLLRKIQKLYSKLRSARPSLGREFFENEFIPLLDVKGISLEDKLATCVESAAIEIAYAAKELRGTSMLCTGGGALNTFLISRILEHCGDDVSIIIPDQDIIQFKEALIFAFLGVLKVTGQANALRSVTGASRDSSSGVMVGFKAG